MGDWGIKDDELLDNPHRRRIRRPPGVRAPAALPPHRSEAFEQYLDDLRGRAEPDWDAQPRGRAKRSERLNPLEGPLLFIGTGYRGPYDSSLQRQMTLIVDMWGGKLERGLTQNNPRRVSAATISDRLWFEWPRHTPFKDVQEWHTLYTFQGRNPKQALLARNRAADALRDTFGDRVMVLVDSSS